MPELAYILQERFLYAVRVDHSQA